MKRTLLGLCAAAVLGGAVAWSLAQNAAAPDLQFAAEKANPVTHLRPNSAADEFQFVIVSDRTGGHRPQVFARAVEQINLLQPEFVVSVGDLIEGYTEDKVRLDAEWREFQAYVGRLQMPFFYVPGNHDITNAMMDRRWGEKFGRRYYDFVYKGVLFLALNSEDPPGKGPGAISAEQAAFVKASVERHKDARHVLVFLHKPMWVIDDGDKNGWKEVEKALGDRPYTVFAGHVHRYQKFVRGGRNYYQLATTGGDSRVRGVEHGEFDHVVWVTMKQDGPVLANVLLDGILREDLRPIASDEPGSTEYYRRPTQAVKGTVTYKGQPVPGAYVVLQSTTKEPRPPRADAFTEADGTFVLSTYVARDGAPTGEYTVTVVQRKPFWEPQGKPGKNLLPEKYEKADTSGLKATVKAGANTLDFNLD